MTLAVSHGSVIVVRHRPGAHDSVGSERCRLDAGAGRIDFEVAILAWGQPSAAMGMMVMSTRRLRRRLASVSLPATGWSSP